LAATDAPLDKLPGRPGGFWWDLLLSELSRLSKIAEQSANDNNRDSFGMAPPELRER